VVKLAVHDNVEKIRKAKGVTKSFLAGKIGLSLQGYRHVANGCTRLDVERLKVMAMALGVDGAIFLDDKLTQSVINDLGKTTA
jgi:transcriptional regulator with XRE-family HTH domain